MLDLTLLRSLHIRSRRPRSHRVALRVVGLDYQTPPRTKIIVEGFDNLPQDRPVFIAMNHTDRFSYGPLMWWMYRRAHRARFLATWVKGKYFSNPAMAWWIARTGNIPIPSRGYLISVTFQQRIGRKPSPEEYRQLRSLLDEKPISTTLGPDAQQYVASWTPDYASGMDALFAEMMGEVMRLHREAFDVARRHVLVFPEGTRSTRLIKGRTGLVEVAQHLGLPIVPIGCSGGDRLYPGDSPISKGGRITFRVGPPLEVDGPALGPHRITETFVPFSRRAHQDFGPRFQTLIDIVMERISDLIEPEYRTAPEHASAQGADRFL